MFKFIRSALIKKAKEVNTLIKERKDKRLFHPVTLIKDSFFFQMVDGTEIPVTLEWVDRKYRADLLSVPYYQIDDTLYSRRSVLSIREANEDVRNLLFHKSLLEQYLFDEEFSFTKSLDDCSLSGLIDQGLVKAMNC